LPRNRAAEATPRRGPCSGPRIRRVRAGPERRHLRSHLESRACRASSCSRSPSGRQVHRGGAVRGPGTRKCSTWTSTGCATSSAAGQARTAETQRASPLDGPVHGRHAPGHGHDVLSPSTSAAHAARAVRRVSSETAVRRSSSSSSWYAGTLPRALRPSSWLGNGPWHEQRRRGHPDVRPPRRARRIDGRVHGHSVCRRHPSDTYELVVSALEPGSGPRPRAVAVVCSRAGAGRPASRARPAVHGPARRRTRARVSRRSRRLLRELFEETTLTARVQRQLWRACTAIAGATYFLMTDVRGAPTCPARRPGHTGRRTATSSCGSAPTEIADSRTCSRPRSATSSPAAALTHRSSVASRPRRAASVPEPATPPPELLELGPRDHVQPSPGRRGSRQVRVVVK
jgi:hypothetical protein